MEDILVFTPHGNASVRSQSEEWRHMAREAAKQLMDAVKAEKIPSDFITEESFKNAVRYMMATGCST